MKKRLNEGNQIHNSISSSGSGTVINYASGSDFLTSYGSGSASQKVTVPIPQHCLQVLVVVRYHTYDYEYALPIFFVRLFLYALNHQYRAGEVCMYW